MTSRPPPAAEEAARILFNACTQANHSFDAATRRDALQRLTTAVVAGVAPLDAAYSVATFFMLNPTIDGTTLTVAP